MLTLEDGRQAFVRPSTMISLADGRVLLAGMHTYIWWRAEDGRWRSTDDSIIGAQIFPDGHAIGIPAPTRRFGIDEVRAVALGGDRAGFAFAEVVQPTFPQTGNARVVGMWYAEYDGRAWSELEQIPLPDSAEVRSFGHSRLIRAGAMLALAIPVMRGQWNDVVVATRVGGRWTSDALGLRMVASVGLENVPGLGLTLALTHPDPMLRSDGTSLFLHAGAPNWTTLRRVAHAGDDQLNFETDFIAGEQDAVLTWRSYVRTGSASREEARAVLRARAGGETRTLDSSIAQAVPVRGAVAPMWVVEHVDALTDSRALRLLRARGDSIAALGQFEDPFIGVFGAIGTPDHRIVVAGVPERALRPHTPVPALLLTFRIACTGARD